ncbi:hypothetical protein [Stenotrophomonas oahuensis]|uniref:Uncharacterized protein n=1 Tax=Stenotrophomonas oahuensis TaxID=3003271 RepID=A0ABY9YNE5_9GAMM|nr:hypothetical protein [Stenotrophomonas sp. A5586]WNH52414.1 hypothetical protein PDM29_19155 [Stenotrophomonas sp. A5586]
MNKNEATFSAKAIEAGTNYGDKKELTDVLHLVGLVDGQLRNVVTVRCYMGRSKSAMAVYATVWIHAPDNYRSGSGTASGWGYCKRSAAIAYALQNAGVTLRDPIDGHGMTAVREALNAVARALNLTMWTVIED